MLRRMRRPAPELQNGGGLAQFWPFDWTVAQMLSRLRPQAPISPAHGPTQSSSSRLLLICQNTLCRRSCSLEFHAGSRLSRVGLHKCIAVEPYILRPRLVALKAASRFSLPKMLDLLVHRTSWESIKLSYSKPKQQMHRHDISYETRIAS
jgi:hypothetical protein